MANTTPEMTPEQRHALAALLREHVRMMAEIRALQSILMIAALDRKPPFDWNENLKTLRNAPEYHAVLEEFEPLIAQFEQGTAENDLIESLQKILAGKPVN